jgi:hypothetical protein
MRRNCEIESQGQRGESGRRKPVTYYVLVLHQKMKVPKNKIDMDLRGLPVVGSMV